MDLRRKLAQLSSAGPGSRPAIPDAAQTPPLSDPPPEGEDSELRRFRIERLRGLIRSVMERDPGTSHGGARGPRLEGPGSPLDRGELPGELRETPDGSIHVIEQILEPRHCHGRVGIAAALEVSPRAIATLALDPALAQVDPRRMLLLDTETTGLAGGTGTLPFLVGLGWFEDESLHLEQLFLRRPGEERSLLCHLSRRLAWSSCMVTYNGKSFDWPLLRTRFVLNRVPLPDPRPHLDLLHCARRVLKQRLRSVRLVDVEESVLGTRRDEEIEASMIPRLYFEYLRTGDGAPLRPVVEHNASDVVALAAVVSRLCRGLEAIEPGEDPRDRLGFARVALRAGDLARAALLARLAEQEAIDGQARAEALLLTARIARLDGDRAREEEALRRALEEMAGEPDAAAAVHLALAKLYEHRERDPGRAIVHARLSARCEGEEASQRRLERLSRRIARARPA